MKTRLLTYLVTYLLSTAKGIVNSWILTRLIHFELGLLPIIVGFDFGDEMNSKISSESSIKPSEDTTFFTLFLDISIGTGLSNA
jgi:hypothetical protein